MEINILMTIQELRTAFLDFLFSHVTLLGDNGILWIVVGVILICTKKHRKIGFLVLFSLLGSFLLGNIFLKNFFERERPCWMYPEMELLIKNPHDYSFPSGHSMASFAAATSLWLMNKKWGAAALILAGMIAFSRLYLFVHWPTDVLVGSVVGILIAVFVFRIVGLTIMERWEYRKGEESSHENV